MRVTVSGASGSGGAVVLDDFNPNGTLIRTLYVPITADTAPPGMYGCQQSTSATSEGFGSASPDNAFIYFACYDSPTAGLASIVAATGTARVIVRVGEDGFVGA